MKIEGFGRNALGPARDRQVVYVTSPLDDVNEPGTLRHALERMTQPRSIVFAGIYEIDLVSHLRLKQQSDVFIDGPVTLRNYGLYMIGCDRVAVNNLRVLHGEMPDRDCIHIQDCHDVAVCNVTALGGTDEGISVSGKSGRITLQDCLIAEGRQPHSGGSLLRDGDPECQDGVSVIRCAYIRNAKRNPRVCNSQVNELVNCVVYGWTTYGIEIGDTENNGRWPTVHTRNCWQARLIDGSVHLDDGFPADHWLVDDDLPSGCKVLSIGEAVLRVLRDAGCCGRTPEETRLLADVVMRS